MAVNKKKIELEFKTRGAKKAAQQTKKLDKSLVSLGKSAMKAGALFLASKAIIKGLEKFTEAVQEASRVESMTTAFSNMGRALDFNTHSLEKLRDATNNTMGEFDLLQQANNALLLGVVKTDDEMAELFDTAQRLARALGRDTLYGIESLVTGMGRQSRLMLDNIGIMVKSEDAYKAMAKRLGTTVAGLTDAQRKQAFLTATMDSAKSKVKQLGEEELTSADKTKQLKVSMENLGRAIAEKAEPQVEYLTEKLLKLVDASTDFISGVEGEETPWALAMREAKKLGDQISLTSKERAVLVKNLTTENELAVRKSTDTLGEFITKAEIANVQFEDTAETVTTFLDPAQSLALQGVSQLASGLAQATIYGSDLGDAVVSSLKAIAAEMAAQAIIFTTLNLMTGGTFGGTMSLSSFLLKGFTGQTPKSANLDQFMLQGFSGQTPTVNNNINISGGIVDDSYIRNSFLPAMRRVQSYG